MTRKEKQAYTRSCLLESAARVFSRRGLRDASVDEVAEDAGFTKGAVYANFKSKEGLFLAMLDERFAKRAREIERLAKEDRPPEEHAEQAGDDFTSYVNQDPEWQRLFFEMCAYAARNPEFRDQLVARYRGVRGVISGAISREAEQHEIASPFPPDQVALMVFAMANGIALEKLLEPEEVPDDLYGSMLSIFFCGLKAMAEAEAEEAGDAAVPAPAAVGSS